MAKTKFNESLSRYRWEFLRKNETYIKSYQQHIKLEKSPTLENRIKFHSSRTDKIENIIFGYFDPTKNYEYHLKHTPNFNKAFIIPVFFINKTDIHICGPIPIVHRERDFDNKPRYIASGEFFIDLEYPKETILRRISDYLDEYKKVRNKEDADMHRTRFGNYDNYLKVYDLREQGWSWDKLANKFYKGDVERANLGVKGINYAKRKVKRDYERCKKLIEGGYGQIR